VVQILGICSEPHRFAIILEYLPGGSLHEYLKNQKEPLPLPRVIELIDGIATGVFHLVFSFYFVSLVKLTDLSAFRKDYPQRFGCQKYSVDFFRNSKDFRFWILSFSGEWRRNNPQYNRTFEVHVT